MVESVDSFNVRDGLASYIQQQHGQGLYIAVYPNNPRDLYNSVTAIIRVSDDEVHRLIDRSHPGFRATLEFDEAVGETITGRRVDVFEDGQRLSVSEIRERFLHPHQTNDGSLLSTGRMVAGTLTLVGLGGAVLYWR